MKSKARSHDDYTVGWICALPLEMAAAKMMLDELHPPLSQSQHDTNTYVLGQVAHHNVAVACLPSGIYGITSAAIVAKQMLLTFHSIQFGLMVGIGGGVPLSADIRLGDIVVSQPSGCLPGVVQYDSGKTVESGRLQRTGRRNMPPQELLTVVSHVESNRMAGKSQLQDHIARVTANEERSAFHSPGPNQDKLFNASYCHDPSCPDCSKCDQDQIVDRKPRSSNVPRVYCGTIASGNQVMKDGQTRDQLARELGILCFEMEAAGLMDHFPCLVIRGICDYADSHKNKAWQGYAAVTAAAYAKELLSEVPVKQTQLSRQNSFPEKFTVRSSSIELRQASDLVGREKELADIYQKLHNDNLKHTVVLHALGGIGKTQLAVKYILDHKDEYSAVFWLDATDPATLKSSFENMAYRIALDHASEENLKSIIDFQNPPAQQLLKRLESLKGDFLNSPPFSWIDKIRDNYTREEFASNLNEESLKADPSSPVVETMKMWLSQRGNTRWLLVYDNYDAEKYHALQANDSGNIRSFLPGALQGHVIITTTSPKLGFDDVVHVQKMSSQQGLRILCSTSGRSNLEEDPYARELVNEMDGVPLYLATVGRYLKKVSISCREYLDLYKEEYFKLEEHAPQLFCYERKIYSNWVIVLRKIKSSKNSAPLDLLFFWMFFDNRDLWREFLLGFETSSSSSLADDPIAFHEAMSVLLEHGIVEVAQDPGNAASQSRGYTLLKPVHSFLPHYFELTSNEAKILSNSAFIHVGKYAKQLLESQNYDDFHRWTPHANGCWELVHRGIAAQDHEFASFFAQTCHDIGLTIWRGSGWINPRASVKFLNAFYVNLSSRVDKYIMAERWFKTALEMEKSSTEPSFAWMTLRFNELHLMHMTMGERFKALKTGLLKLATYHENKRTDRLNYYMCWLDIIRPFGSSLVYYLTPLFLYYLSVPWYEKAFIVAEFCGLLLSYAFFARWITRWKAHSLWMILVLALEACCWSCDVFHAFERVYISRYLNWTFQLLTMSSVAVHDGLEWHKTEP
ncbi:hypothetical protein P170DRAFT_388283 [Aspergillus steynii IBT 23096]|uniref:Nucleoside phosphorylase domain-containing protein n=1 Tax=Aspergillus steynii IBT 23096 TaxID=1392250 RepID=A0A2I2G2K3_9EURO|nr:uncharacterized protein P170DRAFT_388283 [Aspergillus steynii IBT 23096]PLB47087.1 hypothetical protein P170DRAFT_388283 [Aspergillus steynii IBT 23096]